MKIVTVKLGEMLVAQFTLDDNAVLLTALNVNDMPLLSHIPLVITPMYPLTLSVEEKP